MCAVDGNHIFQSALYPNTVKLAIGRLCVVDRDEEAKTTNRVNRRKSIREDSRDS